MAGCFHKMVQEKGVNVLAYDQSAASPPRFFLRGAVPPFTKRPPNTIPKMEDLLVLTSQEPSWSWIKRRVQTLHRKRHGFQRVMENYSQFYVLS